MFTRFIVYSRLNFETLFQMIVDFIEIGAYLPSKHVRDFHLVQLMQKLLVSN